MCRRVDGLELLVAAVEDGDQVDDRIDPIDRLGDRAGSVTSPPVSREKRTTSWPCRSKPAATRVPM